MQTGETNQSKHRAYAKVTGSGLHLRCSKLEQRAHVGGWAGRALADSLKLGSEIWNLSSSSHSGSGNSRLAGRHQGTKGTRLCLSLERWDLGVRDRQFAGLASAVRRTSECHRLLGTLWRSFFWAWSRREALPALHRASAQSIPESGARIGGLEVSRMGLETCLPCPAFARGGHESNRQGHILGVDLRWHLLRGLMRSVPRRPNCS